MAKGRGRKKLPRADIYGKNKTGKSDQWSCKPKRKSIRNGKLLAVGQPNEGKERKKGKLERTPASNGPRKRQPIVVKKVWHANHKARMVQEGPDLDANPTTRLIKKPTGRKET